MAFQIKDDLFDYGDAEVGKPTRIDIQEKKMTLPLIYALNNADRSKKRWLINTVKSHNKEKKRVNELVDHVRSVGGITYATEVMCRYRDEALELLDGFPEGESRSSLRQLVEYTVARDH